MRIRELESENSTQVARTLAGMFVVSTVRREEELKRFDEMIGLVADSAIEAGVDEEDLAGTLGSRIAGDEDYESMVFGANEDGRIQNWEEVDSRRYNTEDEALQGHYELVEKWSDDS